MQQPNYYAIIPANVRYSKISPNAKLLYGEITALTQKEGFCWATNQHLAELYGASADSVSRWVSELQTAGFIEIEVIKNHQGTVRQIRLGGSAKMPDGVGKKPEGGLGKNADHNNTRNNTKNEYLPLTPSPAPQGNAPAVCMGLELAEKVVEDRTQGFEAFWKEYPAHRRVGKAKCLEYWKRDRLAKKTEQIVAAVKLYKQGRDWQKDGGQYICHPQKFLNERRYENEDVRAMMIATTKQASSTDIMDLLIADQEAKEAQGNGNR